MYLLQIYLLIKSGKIVVCNVFFEKYKPFDIFN